MITIGVGIARLIVGFFAGEKVALMIVQTNLRDQGWSDEAIKKRFSRYGLIERERSLVW